jgi:hypothetical protein
MVLVTGSILATAGTIGEILVESLAHVYRTRA